MRSTCQMRFPLVSSLSPSRPSDPLSLPPCRAPSCEKDWQGNPAVRMWWGGTSIGQSSVTSCGARSNQRESDRVRTIHQSNCNANDEASESIAASKSLGCDTVLVYKYCHVCCVTYVLPATQLTDRIATFSSEKFLRTVIWQKRSRSAISTHRPPMDSNPSRKPPIP